MCFRPPSVDEGGESVCSSCGASNPSGSDICTSCGKPLLKVPSAAMRGSAIPGVPSVSGAPKPPGAPRVPSASTAPKPPDNHTS